MTREQFEAERRSGIGGSDVHHLFDLAPYGCRRILWADKRGEVPDYPVYDLGPVRRGRKLEDLVAEEYAEATGRSVTTVGLKRHAQYPEMMVHLDRIIEHRPDVALAGAPPAQGLGALEIKTVNEMALRKWKRHGLPLAYILQLQHGMAVTGLKWGSFALLEPTSWTLLWFDEPRDEGLIGKIEMAARLFWPTVDDEPPPRLDPNSVQCGRCKYRTSCQGEKLESLAMSKDDEMDWGPAPFREDMGALLAEYFELSDIAREAGDLLEAHKDLIRDAMGKEERANAPGAKIYYTESRPSRWDTKALEAAGLAAKYKKQGAPQRTLRIYPR